MDDFIQTVSDSKPMTIGEQKKAGTPVSGKMDDEHKGFLKELMGLLSSGEIDPYEPKSFLKMDIYESLPEDVQDKADLILANLAHEIRLIQEFVESKDTPEESPQLMTMVQHLWATKQQIEKDHDVFKF